MGTEPSVDTLIAQCVPFDHLKHLLERLTTAWCEAFTLQRCMFAWRDSGSHSFVMTNGDATSLQLNSTPFIDADFTLTNFVASRLDREDAIQLLVDDQLIGFAIIPGTSRPVRDQAWVDVSARLLHMGLRLEDLLLQRKLSALAEYSAGAGHEINNPLAAIKGRAAQLLQQETDPQRRQLLQTIGAQTYRIRDMIGDTMLFASPPQLQFEEVDAHQLIENVVHKFLREFQDRQISLWGNRQKGITVFADETQLAVAISELVRNSLNAVENRGRLEIDCEKMDQSGCPVVVLRVRDNGCGFTTEQREHCFDPFYSGRQAGRGLGFGLSKSWRIITNHGGTIVLRESNASWTEFVITVPEKRQDVIASRGE